MTKDPFPDQNSYRSARPRPVYDWDVRRARRRQLKRRIVLAAVILAGIAIFVMAMGAIATSPHN